VTTIEGTGQVERPAPAHLAHNLSFSRAAAPPTFVTPVEVEAVRAAAQARGAAAAAGAAAASAPPGGNGGNGAAPAGNSVMPAGGDVQPVEQAGMNSVAYRLAMNNGTQCGYCSAGFVMNMCGLLTNRPEPTKREIEDVFDGNLCRCTGYRPILTGMETFAKDWTAADEQRRMKLLGEDALSAIAPAAGLKIPLPPGDRLTSRATRVDADDKVWVRPATLAELGMMLQEFSGRRVRMVNGNTSYGVYPDEVRAAEVLVDIQLVPELRGTAVGAEWVDVGASTTYSELIKLLDALCAERHLKENTAAGALRLMARRTAGTIVRNAATLAGNTMLVLEHIERGEPFPSDLLTPLVAVGAEVTVWWALRDGDPQRLAMADLVERVVADRELLNGLVILSYHLQLPPDGPIVFAQKVALRDVNAHALVNATTVLRLTGREAGAAVVGSAVVGSAVVTFGGIAPYPWRASRTEEALRRGPLSLEAFPALAEILGGEVAAELVRWHPRMSEEPWDGVTDEYRVQLAVSFLYKAIVNALLEVAPETVPEADQSAGVDKWGRWPISGGVQSYEIQDWKAPVSQPYVKLMAFYQATGQVQYTHETPVPPRTVNAAWPATTSGFPATTSRPTPAPWPTTCGGAGPGSSSWSPGRTSPIRGSTSRAWAPTSRCSRWSR
jgi:xanthine dehydrogenase/oxidase